MTIQERFERFRAANPEVEARLVALARHWRKVRGYERIGIETLWQVLRWELALNPHDPDSDYRLNDHYRSRYARLLMERYPDLEGLFETRRLRAA